MGVIFQQVRQLAIDDQVLVAVVLGDRESKLAIRTRRESPRRRAVADLMTMWANQFFHLYSFRLPQVLYRSLKITKCSTMTKILLPLTDGS